MVLNAHQCLTVSEYKLRRHAMPIGDCLFPCRPADDGKTPATKVCNHQYRGYAENVRTRLDVASASSLHEFRAAI